MTIHWEYDTGTINVWVHDSDPSTDSPDQSTTREFGKPQGIPREVFDLVFEEAKEAFLNDDNWRVLRILADAAFEQIEET